MRRFICGVAVAVSISENIRCFGACKQSGNNYTEIKGSFSNNELCL